MGKGSMKLLVIVAVIVLLVASWYTLLNDAVMKEHEYKGYIKAAREKTDGKLYADAEDYYKRALAMNESRGLREDIADFYMEIGQTATYVSWCTEIIEKYPYDEDAYVRLAEYYKEKKDYRSCFNILNKAQRRGITSDDLNDVRESVLYMYDYVNFGYEEVSVFSSGCCVAKRANGTWGYAGVDGKTRIGFSYGAASAYNGTYAVVELESGEYAFVDSSGRKKSICLDKKKVIEDAIFFYEDKIALKYDGKYHYCNFEFEELFGSYDYAGTFVNGIAAVNDGGKWYFINANGEPVNDKTYEEIKIDEKGVAIRNNVVFVKANGKYILVDKDGNRVGDGEWTDVDCFNSGEPAAVCNGTKWGYVDTAGNLVVDFIYDNAKSFSNGFAAVAQGDKWGYIALSDNALKIDYLYDGAMDFSSSGTAFVKGRNGWDLIKLYAYNQ